MAANILGQNPADITGALFKSKNFADVPDKTAARTNLNVPSKDDVLYNSVPIGMILPYWGNIAPAGYLPCSGQTITSGSFPDLVTFLGGTTSAVVPDLRGEFLRGWDNGRGVDSGRAVSTWQADDYKSHRHNKLNIDTTGVLYSAASGWAGSGQTGGIYAASGSAAQDAGYSGINTGSSGGTETRPRNVSVLYCIKAYNSVANYTSSFNVAGLINDYSTLSTATVKYSDFIGANQVKAANGYQKLPGGAILQWGTAVNTGNATQVTLPIAFTTTNYSVSCVGISSNFGARGPLVNLASFTNSSFYFGAETAGVIQSTAGTVAVTWTAIGY